MMKRMMFQADEELLARVREVANKRGVSVAQLVRDALEKEIGSPRRPKPTIIGAFSSGDRTDFARRATEAGPVPPVSWRSS